MEDESLSRCLLMLYVSLHLLQIKQHENAYHCSSKLEVYSPFSVETGQSLERMGYSLTEKTGQVWSPVQNKSKSNLEKKRKEKGKQL